MDYKSFLSRRLSFDDVMEITYECQGLSNDGERAKLLELLTDADKRIADNAAYVLSNFALADTDLLADRRDRIIDVMMHTRSETQHRLLLKVLGRMTWNEDMFDGVLLNYCLDTMVDNKAGVASRLWAIRLAFELCKQSVDLLRELSLVIELIDTTAQTPGVRSARSRVAKDIARRLKQLTKK